jgi:hypothetical protein
MADITRSPLRETSVRGTQPLFDRAIDTGRTLECNYSLADRENSQPYIFWGRIMLVHWVDQIGCPRNKHGACYMHQ